MGNHSNVFIFDSKFCYKLKMNPETIDLPLSNLVKKPDELDIKSPAIFFLHGYGSNMYDLFQLSHFFPDKWAYISLQAPIPVTYNGWSWFDLNPINIFELLDPQQIIDSQKKIELSIDICLEKLKIDADNIFLLGFSQGASLTFYTGLKSPKKYKGIVSLCGWFSDKYFLDQFDHKNLDKLKIFIGNGIQDQRINIDMARDSVKNLSSLGTKPHYKEYNCDHTIPNECLVDILEWIKK
tara:strand:+ start:4200 stop:4913 length:714 start_codon:yes stop_codon:yes gene_type:complete